MTRGAHDARLQCEMCGVRMAPGVVLYRASPLGVTPARWRCEAHAGPVDQEVEAIVRVVVRDSDV